MQISAPALAAQLRNPQTHLLNLDSRLTLAGGIAAVLVELDVDSMSDESLSTALARWFADLPADSEGPAIVLMSGDASEPDALRQLAAMHARAIWRYVPREGDDLAAVTAAPRAADIGPLGSGACAWN
jgi:hypothetical protein